ncbi:hypothetical protein WJX72_008058 [[Myrmecia] bisecta]|uniref:Pseudouridine synthase RsuA/RluA-like domain-containing protein n=1 Tax=[Myrmecia] bisecta TaxID=41462 RepID=A0AAW1QRS3_9CHLO
MISLLRRAQRCWLSQHLKQPVSRAHSFTSSSEEELARWQRHWHITPPVSFLPSSEPPTALQWLRRRVPQLSNGTLQGLFRRRQVKVLNSDSAAVKRAAKLTPLSQGWRLLIPKEAVCSAGAGAQSQIGASTQGASKGRGLPKSMQLDKLAAQLRERVVYMDNELLVLDKPAGLAVQGGPGVKVSLDVVMADVLRFGHDEVPRLVHRLDKDTSGAMVIARTADAAAWLSEAFRRNTAGPGEATAGPTVKRTYWAVVEAAEALPDEGCIDQPLRAGLNMQLPGSHPPTSQAEAPHAVSRYVVHGRASGFAWLELHPQTGRKHQLRIHCALGLGSPILGDAKHGQGRLLNISFQYFPRNCDTEYEKLAARYCSMR